MFTEFMGTISDVYDSVDTFFDDLVGESDIIDTALQTGLEAFSGDSGRVVAESIDSPMLDSNMDDTEALIEELKAQREESMAVKSEDPARVSQEWAERLRAIAHGKVYGMEG